MQKTYEQLNKILDVISFGFMCLSSLYGFIWLYCATGLPSGWVTNSPLDLFPSVIRAIFGNTYIFYKNGTVDMSFFIVAIIFLVLCGITKYFSKFADNKAYECELNTIKARKQLEDMVNEELRQENEEIINNLQSALVVIKLDFDFIVDPNISDAKIDISGIIKKSYNKLISKTNFPYSISRGRRDDKAYFIIDQFWCIEHFTMTVLNVMKEIYRENLNENIKTSFVFSASAINSKHEFQNELSDLINIAEFNYRNKLVVTLPFIRRYEKKENKLFDFSIMGTSRYFIKQKDKDGKEFFKTKDYELYFIKRKKQS